MTFADLPAVNACLNGLSAVFLLAGYRYIRQKNQPAHERYMTAAVVTSTLFLICYITYHAKAGRTIFRDPAWFRPIYLALLTSHTVLAVAIVPMVIAVGVGVWLLAALARGQTPGRLARRTRGRLLTTLR